MYNLDFKQDNMTSKVTVFDVFNSKRVTFYPSVSITNDNIEFVLFHRNDKESIRNYNFAVPKVKTSN